MARPVQTRALSPEAQELARILAEALLRQLRRRAPKLPEQAQLRASDFTEMPGCSAPPE